MSGNSNGFGGSVARYLRMGETFESPAAPTAVAPGEMGEAGGAVARYLKVERHERPVARQRPAAEKRPVAKKRSVAKKRPAAKKRSVAKKRPAAKKQRRLHVHHEAPQPRPAAVKKLSLPVMVQCPDCDAKVARGWIQCPNCALLLDTAA